MIPSNRRLTRPAIRLAGLFIVALATSWLSVTFFRGHGNVAAIWPTDAVILAFLLRGCRTRRDQAAGLAVGVAAMVVCNALGGQPPLLAATLPLANGLGVVVAAFALRGVKTPLAGFGDFARFLIGAAILAPLLSAGAGVGILAALAPGADLAGEFQRWALADGVGMVVITPFALSLQDWRVYAAAGTRRLALGLLAQLAVAATATFVFILAPTPSPILLVPVLLMTVFANRDLGGAVAMAVTAVIAAEAYVLHLGGMDRLALHLGRDPLLLIQASITVLAITIQPVAAMLRRLDALMAEKEARCAQVEWESRNKTKMLAHVSHEIRTPLSGVVTLAEMMKSGAMGELTARQKEVVGKIADSGAEIEAISRDLLDAAAVQAGQAVVRPEPVRVTAVIADVVGAAMFRTRDYKATIWAGEGFDPELEVMGDPRRLRQILLNLVLNGAKYGGKPPVVRVDAIEAGPHAVRFLVSDNGTGIPADRRDGLFKAYDRLGAEQSSIEGSGLGLALARELARSQAGELGVEDGELGGACFWLELPRSSPSAAAA